jgi:hypothetical protein
MESARRFVVNNRYRSDRMVRAVLTVLLCCWLASRVGAQQPEPIAPPKQWIPPTPAPLAPAPAVPAPAPSIQYMPYPLLPPPPPRLDSRNAWALFGVDQTGHYRYRVVMSPYGSYYLYNGQPYYGTTLKQTYIQPKTTD